MSDYVWILQRGMLAGNDLGADFLLICRWTGLRQKKIRHVMVR